MKIEEKTILWKPVSEYTGGRVLATNGLDILVGELNPEGDCVSEDCSGIHLCGITHFAKIAGFFPVLKESEDERIRKLLINLANQTYDGASCFKDFSKEKILAWLEKQGEPEDKGEISDGYHTFNELYYYRMLYNAAFFNLLPKEWVHKSKRHHDGEECFGGGWFIVMAELPTGQISNHYELKDWDLFQIPEKEIADKWDGHTPQEAAKRLHEYLLEKQDGQKPALWSEEDEKHLQKYNRYSHHKR